MTIQQGWQGAVIVVLLMISQGVLAAPVELRSGPQRALMIELFTSQGCSSCPPAEAFINSLVEHPRLWQPYIPLAWHVDYWDYLGWKDRFALPENAVRQRRYAALGHVRGVYTPGFMINGRSWRPGVTRQLSPESESSPGLLTVRVDENQLLAHYQATDGDTTALQLHVSLLGVELATDIAAGENRGRHALHHFVVLAHQQLSGTGPQWRGVLPKTGLPVSERRAVAVWVSKAGDPTPLQAVGGWLPSP